MTELPSFSELDRKQVNEAIAAAEKWTEAAILVVVAARSAAYERAALRRAQSATCPVVRAFGLEPKQQRSDQGVGHAPDC